MDDRKTDNSLENTPRSMGQRPRGMPPVYPIASLTLMVLLIIAAIEIAARRPAKINQTRETAPTASVAALTTLPPPAIATSRDNEPTAAPLRADLIPAKTLDSQTEIAGYFPPNPKARILIVRGIFTVFSLGMDDLAAKLRSRGYAVQVSTAAQSNQAAKQLRDYLIRTNERTPVIIIGHSLGGDLAPRLARTFAEKKVPVDMLIMLDSTMPSAPPANVRRCVNLYQSNLTPDWAPVFRGSRIDAHADETEMYNIDIRKLAGKEKTSGINHFNIDANPWIHDLIMEAVQYAKHQFGPIQGKQYAPVRQSMGGHRPFRASDQSRDVWQQSGNYSPRPRPMPTSPNPQQQTRRN